METLVIAFGIIVSLASLCWTAFFFIDRHGDPADSAGRPLLLEEGTRYTRIERVGDAPVISLSADMSRFEREMEAVRSRHADP